MILGRTKSVLVLDAETASPVDLRAEGQYRYWDRPETKTLMVAGCRLRPWGQPTAAVRLIDLERGDSTHELRRLAELPRGELLLAAANCEFDRAALRQLGIDTPPEKWIDVKILAYFLGFSGSLDAILGQVGLEKKDAAGTRLITKFSVKRTPWYDAPSEWQQFREYCEKDAVVEERLMAWLLQWLDQPRFRPMVDRLLDQELTYRRVNGLGIPIDQDAVRAALAIRNGVTTAVKEELQELTQLANPNSRDQLLGWIRGQGTTIPDLQKQTVKMWSLCDLPTPVRRALELRQELGKTSTGKFDALSKATGDDGRLRGGWQFYGASRTGRIAGRILNPANLPRPVVEHPEDVAEWLHSGLMDGALMETLFPQKDAMTTLSSAIRACVCAPPGRKLVVADLSSIESCVIAWVAGCQSIVDVFRAGKDSYRVFASIAFDKPYEDVTKQ